MKDKNFCKLPEKRDYYQKRTIKLTQILNGNNRSRKQYNNIFKALKDNN